MITRALRMLSVTTAIIGMSTGAWAAHPLITDDTGTQGTGKYQVEATAVWARDKETAAGMTTESTGLLLNLGFAAGVAQTVDLLLAVPYQDLSVESAGMTVTDEQGVGDLSLDVKWRFFQQGGLSFALKPGISLPTGDEDKGLGAGKTGYRLFFIAMQTAAPWAFHGNAGYIRNENKGGAEEDLWHLSAAVEYSAAKATRIVGNIGMQRNTDPAADKDPAFGLLGLIHSPRTDLDLSFGVKAGLNDAETDLALLAGVTLRF